MARRSLFWKLTAHPTGETYPMINGLLTKPVIRKV